VIQRGAALLAREDPDVAEEVANIMREDGLEVLLETKPVSVEQSSTGAISLAVQTKLGEHILHGSHLLMAAGRVPNDE
jgi:pyruvate/2-oxoglutarate dehydrogenase complex dihydrolipoamide dehydrogenase (E3) component